MDSEAVRLAMMLANPDKPGDLMRHFQDLAPDAALFIKGAITDAYESGWRPDGFGGAPLKRKT